MSIEKKKEKIPIETIPFLQYCSYILPLLQKEDTTCFRTFDLAEYTDTPNPLGKNDTIDAILSNECYKAISCIEKEQFSLFIEFIYKNNHKLEDIIKTKKEIKSKLIMYVVDFYDVFKVTQETVVSYYNILDTFEEKLYFIIGSSYALSKILNKETKLKFDLTIEQFNLCLPYMSQLVDYSFISFSLEDFLLKNIEEISYGKIAFLALNDNIRKKEKIGTFLCERLKKLYDDISQKLGNEKSEAKTKEEKIINANIKKYIDPLTLTERINILNAHFCIFQSFNDKEPCLDNYFCQNIAINNVIITDLSNITLLRVLELLNLEKFKQEFRILYQLFIPHFALNPKYDNLCKLYKLYTRTFQNDDFVLFKSDICSNINKYLSSLPNEEAIHEMFRKNKKYFLKLLYKGVFNYDVNQSHFQEIFSHASSRFLTDELFPYFLNNQKLDQSYVKEIFKMIEKYNQHLKALPKIKNIYAIDLVLIKLYNEDEDSVMINFSKHDTFDIIIHLFEIDYFNQPHNNLSEKDKKTLDKMLDDIHKNIMNTQHQLEQLNITYIEMKELNSYNNLDAFLKAICFGEPVQIELLKNILRKEEHLGRIKKCLQEVITFFDFYYPNVKNNDKKELAEKFDKGFQIKQIIRDNIDIVNDAIMKSGTAKIFNPYIKSHIFRSLIDKQREKINKEDYIYDYEAKFKQLDFLLNVKDYNNIKDVKIIEEIFRKFSDDSLYLEEIKYLSELPIFHKISEQDQLTLEQYFKDIKTVIRYSTLKNSLPVIRKVFCNKEDNNNSDNKELPSDIKKIQEIANNAKEVNYDKLSRALECLANEDFLNFLHPKMEDSHKVKQLSNILDSDDEVKTDLQPEDIESFINVIGFCIKLKEILLKKTDNIMKDLGQLVKEDLNVNHANIELDILRVQANQKKFEELLKKLDKYNNTKELIKKYYNECVLTIEEIEGFNHKWKLTDKTGKNVNNGKVDLLKQLKDDADIIKFSEKEEEKRSKSKSELSEEKILHSFIELVRGAEKIDQKCKIILSKGSKLKSIKLILKPKEEIRYDGHSLESIDELINILDKEIEKIDSIIKGIYKQSTEKTFVFGKLFRKLHESFHSEYPERIKELSSINDYYNYITKGDYTKPYFTNDDTISPFKTVENNLSKFYELNAIKVDNFFDNSIVTSDEIMERVKDYDIYECCFYGSLERVLMNEKMIMTGNKLSPYTILICNEDTTEEEIIAFLYRVAFFKSTKNQQDSKVVFIIANLESLSIYKCQVFIDVLVSLYQDNSKKDTILLIGDHTKDYDLITKLNKRIQVGVYDQNDLLKSNLTEKYKDNKVTIVKSELAGFGKSFWIKKKSEKENKKYCYFPIGGIFSKEILMSRLHSIEQDNTLIHIDLIDYNKTEETQMEILKDFIFSISVLKYYHYKEDYFWLNKDTEIYIEIPNGYYDFYNNFEFLQTFDVKEITKQNKEVLENSKDLTKNDQIVAIYIKNQDDLEDEDFHIDGVSNGDKNKGVKKVITTPIQDIQTLFENDKLVSKDKEVITLINKDMNFYQINAIINIIGENLKLFNNDFYISVSYIMGPTITNKLAMKSCRSTYVNSLKFLTKYLVNTENYLKIREEQVRSLENEKAQNVSLEDNILIETITYDQIPKNIIFINDDGASISIILMKGSKEKDEMEHKELKILYNSQIMGINPALVKNIPSYYTMDSEHIYLELRTVLNINTEDPLTKGNKSLYVFTPDNFIKVIYIILRMRAGVPSIMVGETGCGKTSLIKVLAKIKRVKLLSMNLHAGITDQDIIDFINNKVEKYIADKAQTEDKDKPVWVFFDEINTCNSLGLISEIMCKRTLQGKPINDKIFFFGACNPFKLIPNRKNEGLELEEDKRKLKLVYLVKPLPDSLLNFVFYFGSLHQKDERAYIKNILANAIFDAYQDKYIENTTQLISDSQKFLREKNGYYSVSLRDIRRFCKFYNWFKDLYRLIQELKYIRVINQLSSKEIQDNSVVLSLYMTYYIRLTNKEDRMQYKEKIENFDSIVEQFQNIIFDDIFQDSVSEGIAKSKGLLATIFCIFTCMNTQTPLIICGKPGCGKSLSASKIFQAMKGINSKGRILKKLPQPILISYQGSLTSTSKEIESIFSRAKSHYEGIEHQENYIPVVYIDELGLAEKAKDNPLKVLHYTLETDEDIGMDVSEDNSQKSKKLAFIGISNWSIDASKMNRAVFLSIPDLDLEDLKDTSRMIGQSYEIGGQYNSVLEALATTYYEFKENNMIKPYNSDKRECNYYGLRDFYHLVKYVCRKIKKIKKDEKVDAFPFEGIQRNFGGSDYTIEMLNLYKEKKNKSFTLKPVCKFIEDNFYDYDSRFLILFSKPSLSHFIIKELVPEKHSFLIGSMYDKDMNEEHYFNKILTTIQKKLETDCCLILQDLNKIYPSFYDLFNQNYTKVQEKNFAKIGLGNKRILLAEVNKLFRCVILLDIDQRLEQSPPFLNRFEKQIVTVDDLIEYNIKKTMDKEKQEEIQRVYNEIIKTTDKFEIRESLLKQKEIKIEKEYLDKEENLIQEMNKKINEICDTFCNEKSNLTTLFNNQKIKSVMINLQNQLINITTDDIKGLIYSITKNNLFLSKEEIEDQLLDYIVPTLSQDIIAFLSISGYEQQFPSAYKKILDKYKSIPNMSLESYLNSEYSKKSNKINVVYTFSSIYDQLILSEKFKSNNNIKNICVIDISAIKTEEELQNSITNYCKKDEKENGICFIRLNENDINHLNNLQSILHSQINDIKRFVILIYLERAFKDESVKNYISFINSEYKHCFVDNLFSTNSKEKFYESLKSSSELLEKQENLFNEKWNDISSGDILSKIQFTNLSNKEYAKKAAEAIQSKKDIDDLLKEPIKKFIHKDKSYIERIFSENFFPKGNIDFYSIINTYIHSLIEPLKKTLLSQIAYDNALHMILFNDSLSDSMKELFKKYISKINLHIEANRGNLKVETLSEMEVPGSYRLFGEFLPMIQSDVNKYQDIQKDIMKQIQFNDGKEIDDCLKNKRLKEMNLLEGVENKFKKQTLIEIMDEHFFGKELLHDYLIFFLEKNNFTKNSSKVKIKHAYDLLSYISNEFIKEFSMNDVKLTCKNIPALFLWIESYSSFLIQLIRLVLFLFDNNIDLTINEISNNKEMVQELIGSDKSITQKIFYIIVNMIVKLSTIQIEKINGKAFPSFLKKIYEIYQICTDIYLIEINDIEKILIAYEKMNSCKEMEDDDKTKVIKQLHLLIKKKLCGKDTKFREYFNLIKENVSEPKILINLLIAKIKKKKEIHSDLNKEIIDIILQSKEFIEESQHFFMMYLPSLIKNPINENTIETFCDNEAFNDFETILKDPNFKFKKELKNIFKFFFECYIKTFLSEAENNCDFLAKVPLKCLEKCINAIQSKSEKRLQFLFNISYVRQYCYFYALLCLNKEIQETIDKVLFDPSNTKLNKTLKLFILKIIKNEGNSYAELNKLYFPYYQKTTKTSLNYPLLSFFQSDNDYEEYLDYCEDITNKLQNSTLFDNIDITPPKALAIYDSLANYYYSVNQTLSAKGAIYTIREKISNKNEKLGYYLLNMVDIINDKKASVDETELFLNVIKINIFALESDDTSFYYKLLMKIEDPKNLKKIPGLSEKKEVNSNEIKEKKKNIKEQMIEIHKENPRAKCQLCSCGYYFFLGQCGFPTEIQKCKKCGKDMGGTNHNIVDREGIFIVYMDQNEKKESIYFSNNGINEKHSIFIDELELAFQTFQRENNDKELTQFSYLILNFVYYSIIYNDNKAVYRNILKDIWKYLKEEIEKDGYKEPTMFLYIYMSLLRKIIHSYSEDIKEFKKAINDLYKITEFQYASLSIQLLPSLKVFTKDTNYIMVNELEKSDDNFEYIPNPSKKDLQRLFYLNKNYAEEYPVLNSIVNNELFEKLKKLRCISLINPFVNQMINKYSFQISRNDAKEKIIDDTDTTSNEYYEFQKGWAIIQNDANQYGCHQLPPLDDLFKIKNLNYYLNDNMELSGGMYIASAYDRMINWQNELLNSIALKEGRISNNEKNMIMIQDAKEQDIINIKKIENIDKIIEQYSKVGLSKDNKTIIIYDLEGLEKELHKLLIVGTKQLKQEQKYVVFIGEMYTDNFSSFLGEFITKYPQTKTKVRNYNMKQDQAEKFLNALQNLIYHLNINPFDKETTIQYILTKLPSYIKIPNEVTDFFKKNPEIKLNNLISFYDYVEKESFSINNRLPSKFQKDLDNIQKKKIKEYYSRNVKDDNILISKEVLKNAVKVFLQRYLFSKIDFDSIKSTDFNEQLPSISFYWPNEVFIQPFFDNEIKLLLKDLDISTEQCEKLYDFLQNKV